MMCEKSLEAMDGRVVWQDEERRLYVEGTEPVMMYIGERYTFGCQPYEPMVIIRKDEKAVAFIHNAFYPDECKDFQHFALKE